MKLTHPVGGGAALLALTLTTTVNSAGQIPDAFRQIDTELSALASGPPSVSGIALGLLGAWAVSHSIASLLFDVSAADPLTFAVTALALGGVASLACAVPALRAFGTY